MTSLTLLIAFVAASFILAITPGPGVFYIVTRTLAQGRAVGLASVAGVALGNFGNAVAASLGLAALFAISSMAFTVVKYAGAAYLVWMGLKALRTPSTAFKTEAFAAPQLSRIFRDGLVVALLNPKTTIFFAAFLPQFIDPSGSHIGQSLSLGAVFVAIAACTDTLYVLGAALAGPRLRLLKGAGGAGRWLSGGAFIGLGLLTAFTSLKPAK